MKFALVSTALLASQVAADGHGPMECEYSFNLFNDGMCEDMKPEGEMTWMITGQCKPFDQVRDTMMIDLDKLT